MHAEQAVQVHRIFSESNPAGQGRTAKHPHGRGKGFCIVLPFIHKKAKYINKISAFHRHINADNAL